MHMFQQQVSNRYVNVTAPEAPPCRHMTVTAAELHLMLKHIGHSLRDSAEGMQNLASHSDVPSGM